MSGLSSKHCVNAAGARKAARTNTHRCVACRVVPTQDDEEEMQHCVSATLTLSVLASTHFCGKRCRADAKTRAHGNPVH